ncbi:hypothetical protein AV530_004935 [Patagioenas fasciata monilis]|uniref:Uncharacterized protein n=1 Tax=Patagioenas fasciata monilis TaxID=372326 RepID=A0A1V4K536_PATFA|nr:hypothetical protein AV530_004935 [Patagioenas fasciata monilis]
MPLPARLYPSCPGDAGKSSHAWALREENGADKILTEAGLSVHSGTFEALGTPWDVYTAMGKIESAKQC